MKNLDAIRKSFNDPKNPFYGSSFRKAWQAKIEELRKIVESPEWKALKAQEAAQEK